MTKDNAMSDGLKPCPFCGGAAETRHMRAGEDVVDTYIVCIECGASSESIESSMGMQAIGFDLNAAAAAAWNRRAERTGEREALADALHWALDILDMYESRLIQLGDPRELVHSEVQMKAKAKARRALAAHARQDDEPEGYCEAEPNGFATAPASGAAPEQPGTEDHPAEASHE